MQGSRRVTSMWIWVSFSARREKDGQKSKRPLVDKISVGDIKYEKRMPMSIISTPDADRGERCDRRQEIRSGGIPGLLLTRNRLDTTLSYSISTLSYLSSILE
jgi:hypothetical protein